MGGSSLVVHACELRAKSAFILPSGTRTHAHTYGMMPTSIPSIHPSIGREEGRKEGSSSAKKKKTRAGETLRHAASHRRSAVSHSSSSFAVSSVLGRGSFSEKGKVFGSSARHCHTILAPEEEEEAAVNGGARRVRRHVRHRLNGGGRERGVSLHDANVVPSSRLPSSSTLAPSFPLSLLLSSRLRGPYSLTAHFTVVSATK